jgi:hypothetical protein
MIRFGMHTPGRRRLFLTLTASVQILVGAIVVAGFFSPVARLEAQDKLKGSMDRKILQSNPNSGRFYNQRGYAVGRTESRNGSSRVYDFSGRSLGSMESRGGSTRFYAPSGSVQGRAETRGNQTRFYDRSGRSMGTSQTSGNSTRFYSPSVA